MRDQTLTTSWEARRGRSGQRRYERNSSMLCVVLIGLVCAMAVLMLTGAQTAANVVICIALLVCVWLRSRLLYARRSWPISGQPYNR